MNTKEHTLWATGGVYVPAKYIHSPNQNFRPHNRPITLVVLHNISLPPNEFGGVGVESLFTNTLNPKEHPYYAQIAHVEVSSHFYIRREGTLIQFVGCEHRAWHAGKSMWSGSDNCNDYSIGVELEGSDVQAFTEAQYQTLIPLLTELIKQYPIEAIVGHQDIAPGRKTDPGPHFDWLQLKEAFPKIEFP